MPKRPLKLMLFVPHQLVQFDGVNARAQVSLPLGILSMAAYLRAQEWGGSIDVYDARLSARFSEVETHQGRRVVFGDDEAEMAARIVAIAPDVVGISNMFSTQFERALRAAEIVKEQLPDAVVVIGGPHASVFPMDVLAHPSIDYVVVGEGEERLHALLKCIEIGEPPQIQGVLGRPEDAGLLLNNPRVKIGFIKSVDDLPLPAYDMVDVERYFELQANGFSPRTREWGKRAATVLTSRGCPRQCTFCSIQATMGYRWRPHSPDYVRRHLRLLRDRYAVDYLHFEDDNLTHDPARFDQLLNVFEEFSPSIPWDTPNGVRGDTWTLERVRRAKETGCQHLVVAIESAVQRVLDHVVRKRLDLAQVDDLMRYTDQVGLRLMAFYVVGLPGERLEDIDTTFRYALARYFRYGVWPGMNLAVALPGTELHEIAERENLRDSSLPYAANQITTSAFCPADIDLRYRRFQRLKLMIFLWRTFTSWRDLSYNLKLVWRYKSQALRELGKFLRRT